MLVPSLAFLIVFPILFFLGLWQLDRADEKRDIEKSVNSATDKPPLLLNSADKSNLQAEVYRRVVVTGQYDNARQYLWDNKTDEGRPGYQVLTPFVLEDSKIAVIVNRGWVPMLGRRDQLPDIIVGQDIETISGVIKDPSNTIQLAERIDQSDSAFPHFVQAFEPDIFESELKISLLPVMIELAESEKSGYVRNWQPFFGKIERHNGYALQWFVMALIVLFLYFKLNLKRIEK
jgi:surfeit locus 1 family protein